MGGGVTVTAGADGWTADVITGRCYHMEAETLSADCYSLAVNCVRKIRGRNLEARKPERGEHEAAKRELTGECFVWFVVLDFLLFFSWFPGFQIHLTPRRCGCAFSASS
jgi:hypothetical protein